MMQSNTIRSDAFQHDNAPIDNPTAAVEECKQVPV